MLKTQTTGYVKTETEAIFRPYYQQQHQLPNDINKNNHPNSFSTAIIEKGKNKQKAILIEARALYQKNPKLFLNYFIPYS